MEWAASTFQRNDGTRRTRSVLTMIRTASVRHMKLHPTGSTNQNTIAVHFYATFLTLFKGHIVPTTTACNDRVEPITILVRCSEWQSVQDWTKAIEVLVRIDRSDIWASRNRSDERGRWRNTSVRTISNRNLVWGPARFLKQSGWSPFESRTMRQSSEDMEGKTYNCQEKHDRSRDVKCSSAKVE